MLYPPARPLTQRQQGEANHTAVLDAQGNWIAVLQLNGEMTTSQQDELVASMMRDYHQYETMYQALLTARQHILQLSDTVNTLSERQGLGRKVHALDFHEGIDAALAHTPVDGISPMTYEQRVLQYEAEGLTTSDAQSVCDVEDLKRRENRTNMSHSSPGPWDAALNEMPIIVRDKYGAHVAKILAYRQQPLSEYVANARLVKMGPEMLKVLKMCQVRLFMLDGIGPEYEEVSKLLTKVEGEKPNDNNGRRRCRHHCPHPESRQQSTTQASDPQRV